MQFAEPAEGSTIDWQAKMKNGVLKNSLCYHQHLSVA
jgi:hypothetical protein